MSLMKITKSRILGIVILATFVFPLAASAQQGESHIGKYTGHVGTGRQLYFRYCWGCHGFRGDGNGENGPYLNILPRNFVAATYKCRSTPTGTLPTDQDLVDSLVRGLNNSNMPSWITLTDQNRADLVAFIKTFSPRWKTDKPGDIINVPAEPALTVDSIKHGKELFTKLECWKCHGAEGRGDGPSASTLTDSNDQPIRPYNFAAGSRFKCGTSNHDLYKIFMTGLDGTPMPSFADVIKPEDAWDLVHYLRTLQVTHKSPELALWMSTKEGAEIVNAQRITGTPTGSGIKQ
ncbi:MAG TPA: cytochrome c [Candidatus Dormibacteraeota bacterium]|nr:cytochrome c [Candidatus Dormibacteraeota bacterium]